MSLKSFLAKIRRQEPSLPNLKIVGGPLDIIERVQVAFMPDAQTTPRSIDLRKSEDGRVHAVVWNIGKGVYSQVFKDEAEAKKFYDETRLQLMEQARAEAARVKDDLEREFAESWKDAKTVYFHRDFKVRVLFSESEKAARINRRLLGLIKGECPFCGTVQVFDARESLKRFLEGLDRLLESSECLMPSHRGQFSEVGMPVHSRCLNCLSYPNIALYAQTNKPLLKQLKTREGGLAEPKGVSNFVSYEQLQNSLKPKKVEKPSREYRYLSRKHVGGGDFVG